MGDDWLALEGGRSGTSLWRESRPQARKEGAFGRERWPLRARRFSVDLYIKRSRLHAGELSPLLNGDDQEGR